MTNKKRKGFTIVELVIVIAVIAILAGVLIPTFASIIDKANQSSDIQAVRQMNVLLKAESVDKTLSIGDVINIVSEAGYDTEEKLTPKSKSNYFYWHSGTNTIFLAKVEESKELIYPKDNDVLTTNFNTLELTKENGFHELVQSYKDNPPSAGSGEGGTPEGDPLNGGLLKDDNGVLETIDDVLYLKGGKYYLTENTTIDTAITISEDVTIDLNGNTLTLEDPSTETNFDDVITVLGTLNVVDNSEESGEIIIKEATNDDSDFYVCGIYVEGGTLDLNGVNVEGNRYYNIDGSATGEIVLHNTIYTLSYGYGIWSKGTTKITGDIEKQDDDEIWRGQFISSDPGNAVAICSDSGSTTIEGIKLSGIYYVASIQWASDGKLTLRNVQIDSKEGNVYYCGVNASKGTVEIYGGTYNCSLNIFAGENSEDVVKINDYTILDENEQVLETKTAIFKGLVECGGGNVKGATVSSGVFDGGFTALKGTVNITGGTFNKTVTLHGTDSTINIFDGEFEAYLTEDIIKCENKGVINICGGEFNGKIEMTPVSGTRQSYIHIFNYNSTADGCPKFYDGENYTSFDEAGYSGNIISSGSYASYVKSKAFTYAIEDTTYNTWVTANGTLDNYSPPAAPVAPTE